MPLIEESIFWHLNTETMSNIQRTIAFFFAINQLFCYSSERAALQFLASGKVQLSGIDSAFFDISNVHEAFGLLNSGTISNIFVQPSQLDDENNGKQKSKTS